MAHILLIEDDELLRPLLARCLEAAGHAVTQAPTGRAGMRAFRAKFADLVITDIVMPDQEGIATIMGLHRDHPEVPVIAMSGGGANTALYLELAKKLGARFTLAKPFSPQDLLRAVEALNID
jgi:DNA-binding response OmpR family regulator